MISRLHLQVTGCVVFFLFLAGCQTPNTESFKNDPKAYHDSGQYERDLNKVAKQALSLIKGQPKIGERDRHPPIPAIILNVDNTALSDWDYMVASGFHYDSGTFYNWAVKANAQPILPVLRLYQEATKRGIPVIFVSERREDLQDVTKLNLKKAGFTSEKLDLVLGIWPSNDTSRTISAFKAALRSDMEDSLGLKIIMNVGDKDSDLDGGHAEHTFKLPNPSPWCDWPM